MIPKFEQDIPIAELNGKFYTPKGARRLVNWEPISDSLLIERVRRRLAKVGNKTIYRLHEGYQHEITTSEILKRMIDGDQEYLEAERKLLEHMRRLAHAES